MTIDANGFTEVAKLSAFPESGILPLEVDDRFVVLAKFDGQIYCIDDVCTHDGGPLSEGDLKDCCIVCPRHGAQFDVQTGIPKTMPATEPTATHQVRIDGDRILVKLSDSSQ